MIYFDNAATSGYKPPEVIDAVNYAMKNLSANPGRSGHKLSVAAMMQTANARNAVAELVNAETPDNVVFSLNCTSALNLAILGSIKRGCHIISSLSEHNSILRPLCELKQRRLIDVTFLVPDYENKISPYDVEKAIRRNTTLVVLGHVSNVTGAEHDIETIGKIAKRNRLTFIVDGAQSVGYTAVDMQRQNIDLLAFPAHKGLHGIMGLGCLCFKEDAKPQPIIYGGTGTDSHMLTQPTTSPEAYESGTQNLPAIAGLVGAIEWYKRTGEANGEIRRELAKMIFDGLHTVHGVNVVSSPNFNSGIVSFYLDNMDSLMTSDVLNDKYDIACRAGLHCAPLIHRHLGTEKQGLVRVSVSAENTKEEVYAFLNAVDDISKY